MTEKTPTKTVFEMAHLTRDQVQTAEKGLAAFKAIGDEMRTEDFVDAIGRFRDPLGLPADLPEALEQVAADLAAIRAQLGAWRAERAAAEKHLRESLKPHFAACDRHAALLDERLSEAHRNIKAAEFAKNLAEDLRNQRADDNAIAKAEDRADVAGARAAFERLLAEANSERAAIVRFRKTLDVETLPEAVLALLAQSVEA